MRVKSIVASGAIGAALMIITTACGSGWDQTHNHSTPTGPYVTPENTIIEFPYNYDNVARACVAGDGVYMPFNGKTTTVVPNDPACKGAK